MDDSSDFASLAARLLTLFGLVSSLTAGYSLWHARPVQQVVVRGTLSAGPEIPLSRVEVDADLRFSKIRCKIRPGGQQYIAFPAQGPADVWAPKVDSSATYSLEWRQAGQFELKLGLPAQSSPSACRLTFRLPGGGELCSRSFLLTAPKGSPSPLWGEAPPVVVDRRALPASADVTRALPAPGATEPPDVEVQSEVAEIRLGAESALLNINQISNRELRARVSLIQSLQGQPNDSPRRTLRIGQLLADILHGRMEMHKKLSSAQGSFVQADADVSEPLLERAASAEND